MERYARLLKKNEDAEEYASLAEKVKIAINSAYLNRDNSYYANNTVTANALSLSFDIPPTEVRNGVFENLVHKTIHEYNNAARRVW